MDACADECERGRAEQAAADAGIPLVLETETLSEAPAGSGAGAGDVVTLVRFACETVDEGEEVERAQELHEAGARTVLLSYPSAFLHPDGEDASAYLRAVLRSLRTKRSGKFVASAFGGLPADGSTPEKRNPKLWRRAQKEAKEIMNDSKKKYGHLDMPKQ